MKKFSIFEYVDETEEAEDKITVKSVIKYILIIMLTFFICFYEFPYYIDKPGGIDNINDKVKVENGYKSDGTINLTYVSEVKGTLPFLIVAYFHPDWTIESKESINKGTLTYKTDMIRQHILMRQSYTTSIKYAYEAAGKDIKVKKEDCYVIYVFDESDSNLEVGDLIINIDGKEITYYSDIYDALKEKEIGDKIKIKVLNNNKEYERTITLFDGGNGNPVIGIQIGIEYHLEANPKFNLEFDRLEYGPSGGLMISLAVYNSLVKEDITGGKIIAGTGTLNSDGTVGPIGGIDYKLKGAVKAKADVFFAPSEENYDDAIKLKKEKGYDIDIVRVEKFEDALKYLENNVMKK